MSSPSAVSALYGASKTYGRNRDDPAVRSFDAMMSGKSAPMKASAAHTKWGNTNYVAMRDRKKGHVEAPFKSRELKTQHEDPFSFDTDDKGKTSPTKTQPPAVSAGSSSSYHKHSTRLPASRIFTPGNLEASSSTARNSYQPSNVSPESLCAIARPGRTYTRSHEGRIKASPTKQRYMDQFIDVGKPVSRDLGASASALCSIDTYKPVSTSISVSPNYVSLSPHKSPVKRTAESRLLSPSTFDSDDTDSNDTFLGSSRSPSLGMQGKSPPTPFHYDSYDSPPKKLRIDAPELIHGHGTAFKPNASVGGSYSSQYKDTCFHADPAAKSVFNSRPLAPQRPGNQDVRPLTDKYVSGGRDDVQAKCFSNTPFSIKGGSSDRPLFDSSSSTSLSSSSSFVKSRVQSQETSCLVRQAKHTPVIDVDDENFFLQSSPSSSRSVLAPKNHSVPDASRLDRDKPVDSLSLSSAVAEISSSNRSSSGDSSKFSRNRSTVSSSQSSGDSSKFSRDGPSVSSSQSFGDSSQFSTSRSTVSSSHSSAESSHFISKSRSNTGDVSKLSRDQLTLSSSRSSFSSSNSKTKSKGSSNKITNKTSTSGSSAAASSKADSASSSNRRINSGVKQYRIFKSRRPAQPQSPPREPLVEEEEVEDTAISSPSMPELDPELPELFSRTRNQENPHSPPDITDQEETDTDTAAESSQLSQENTDSVDHHSQESFTEVSEALQDAEDSMPDLLARPLESRDTPSPASVDSPSQELAQDALSADSSHKEDVPAAPRRFFKSRKSADAPSLQRKMLKKSQSKFSYNVRSWHQDENVTDKTGQTTPPVAHSKWFSESEESAPSTSSGGSVRELQLTRSVTWPKDGRQPPIMSVKVNPQHKQLYKVVQNVKMAHEVQEEGETQDFMDDVQYLLDNLSDHQPVSIRALSTIQLAGKCILPSFRMHLRAHGIVTKIFCLLHDACSYPTLALSTAATMFMLSQDRLNMDLDKQSLNLMLKLNEVDLPRTHHQDAPQETVASAEDSAELDKCRQRVQDLLCQLQRESKTAKPFDLQSISTGNLAMESLLSLTSRRAGDWFKEELRTLGGLDHFVETVHHCVSSMKEDLAYFLDSYTPVLNKLDRCLRVLENITFMNCDNQSYVSAYKDGLLITASGRLLLQCVESLPIMPLTEMESEAAMKQQQGWIVLECLLAVLRVLLNITHDCEFGCTRVGAEEGLVQTVLQCVINVQWCVPLDLRFDVLVLSLGLLINLMEHCPQNRRLLVECTLAAQILEEDYPLDMDALQALVQLFLQRESAAKEMEEAPETPVKSNPSLNKSGEWRESESGIEWIARSAEKVKAAEKQRHEAAGEGSSKAGEKTDSAGQGDGASSQDDEETFTKALHKAGKHMENSIVASYVGLLLGCLIQDNHKYADLVMQYLPDGSFESMIKILKKFLGFMSLTTAVGSTDANSIQRVIDTLEAC